MITPDDSPDDNTGCNIKDNTIYTNNNIRRHYQITTQEDNHNLTLSNSMSFDDTWHCHLMLSSLVPSKVIQCCYLTLSYYVFIFCCFLELCSDLPSDVIILHCSKRFLCRRSFPFKRVTLAV
jgi:hypothetical protein